MKIETRVLAELWAFSQLMLRVQRAQGQPFALFMLEALNKPWLVPRP